MFASNINWVDLIIIAVLVVGLTEGFVKGIVKQLFGIAGLFLGLIMGKLFCAPVAEFLQNCINMSDRTAVVVAFILILLVVPLACTIVGHLLSGLVKAVQLGFIDRVLGGVLGFLKYLIILGLVFQLFELTGLDAKINDVPEGKNSSRFYEPVRKATDTCLRWTWKKIQEGMDLESEDRTDARKV